MTFDEVYSIAAAWPGVELSTSYGTPALKVKGKLLTRLREDGDSLVIRDVAPEERDMMIAAQPDVFYLTDHYRPYPMMLLRLLKARSDQVEALLERSYRAIAPKRLRDAMAAR